MPQKSSIKSSSSSGRKSGVNFGGEADAPKPKKKGLVFKSKSKLNDVRAIT